MFFEDIHCLVVGRLASTWDIICHFLNTCPMMLKIAEDSFLILHLLQTMMMWSLIIS
jgi:hypothetical protein